MKNHVHDQFIDQLIQILDLYLIQDNPDEPSPQEKEEYHFSHAYEQLSAQLIYSAPSKESISHRKKSIRLYSPSEQDILSEECQGFLFFLEKHGVLPENLRELVIDYVLANENEKVDFLYFKKVVLSFIMQHSGVGWDEKILSHLLNENHLKIQH